MTVVAAIVEKRFARVDAGGLDTRDENSVIAGDVAADDLAFHLDESVFQQRNIVCRPTKVDAESLFVGVRLIGLGEELGNRGLI